MAEDLAKAMGSGVFGFARTTEGPCGPGDRGPCNVRLAVGLEIRAFSASDVVSNSGAEACRRGFRLSAGATPVATTKTDSSGIYRMALPPGRYAMTTTDPIDQCGFMAGHAEPKAEMVDKVIFDLDHGAY
jgi:hypothetical protein